MAGKVTNLSTIIVNFIESLLDRNDEGYMTCNENSYEESEVSKASELLSMCYKKEISKLGLTTKFINFREDPMKLAYVIRYSNIHAHSTCHFFTKCLTENLNFRRMIKKIRTAAPCNIVSLGAGPGSDVLGLMIALHTTLGVNNFHCGLLDKYSEWSEYSQQLLTKAIQFNPNLCISLAYKRFDFSKKLKSFYKKNLNFANINLLCICKFLNEVLKAFGNEAENNLKTIFNGLSKNAIVYFMDNHSKDLKSKMADLAKQCHLECIYVSNNRYTLPANVIDPVKKYRDSIGGKPKNNRAQNLSVIIYRKL